MSRINPIYTDRVRYRISHNPTGIQKVLEPRGWKDDDNEFVRDKVFQGILPQMTNDLTFFSNGGSFIESVLFNYGINADITMIKEERNNRTDIWETKYSGYLDLTTYSKENNGISIKFISSNFLRMIKARQNEKIEVDRLETFKGENIPYLVPNKVNLAGRTIFLSSLLETSPDDSTSVAFRMRFQTQAGETASLGVPLGETFTSDVKVIPVDNDLSYTSTPEEGVAEGMFYINNDIEKTFHLKINCSFNTVVDPSTDISDLSSDAFLYLALVKFKNGVKYDFPVRENLTQNIINENGVVLPYVTVSFDNPNYTLLEGESLALQWYGGASIWGDWIGPVPYSYGYIRPVFKNINTSVKIEEYSTRPATVAKFYLPFELFTRFLKLITSQDDAFSSNVFGRTDLGYKEDGDASLIGITHGFWIRGFSKSLVYKSVSINSEENRYKSMTLSFKDVYESYFKIWNLGASIESVGFKEVFVVEKLEYFYNKNILIRLGEVVDGVFKYVQVSNVKRTLDKTVFNSSIEAGFEKGAEYEEAIGLDEYNGKTTVLTIINKLESVLNIVSKIRGDSYGIEFARRFPFIGFSTQDTKYDSHNWFLDLERGVNEIFQQRLWRKDFEEAPTGIFDVETAQNLRLSPFNILLRHGWRIGAGLVKYPLDYIRYGSSTANSGLTTKLKGGSSISENGNIQNNSLELARTDGEIVNFNFEVDDDLLKEVRGKTLILGKEVPNFYGLVSFKNENAEIEEGYLEKLSTSGQGSWVIKKFNK